MAVLQKDASPVLSAPRIRLLGPADLLTRTATAKPADHSRSDAVPEQRGIRFIENRGQITDTEGRIRGDIAFIADAPGARLFFRNDGISYVFMESTPSRDNQEAMLLPGAVPFTKEEAGRGAYRLDMTLTGCSPNARVRPEGELHGYSNYYLAHCPDGITGVREYSRIVYENVYNNIDLELFSSQGRMKYNFVVRPGGSARDIRMDYAGATGAALTTDGALAVVTPLGRIEEAAPYTYAGDESNEIGSRFLRNGNTVSFAVDAYDASQTLVIDPWATYYGGSGDDKVTSISTDASNNVIASGYTASVDFPVSTGAYQTSIAGDMDVFIVKFDAFGNRQWATYFGGSGDDGGGDLFYSSRSAVDINGNIVVAGYTDSPNLPVTAGGFQTSYAGAGDIFVAKFSASGSRVWATYYGGSGEDGAGVGIATDPSGRIVFTGSTQSANFPVSSGAFQTTHGGGGNDVFVVKMNADGSRSWATFYGGNKGETAFDVAADGNEHIVITGYASTRFPVTSGAFQTSFGGGAIDGFIVQFDAGGSRLWATYCGGSENDYTRGIATDMDGNVIISGFTMSTNYPVTAGAFQVASAGGIEAFAAKFSAGGGRLWSTYCGGASNDWAFDVCTDPNKNILFTGHTASANFPVSQGAFQPALAVGYDAFIMKMDPNGARMWATYYGGNSGTEYGFGIATDGSGNVLMGGYTASTNLPTLNAYQPSYAGALDAFLVQLNASGLLPGYNTPPVGVAAASPTQGTAPLTVNFNSAGSYDPDGTITGYEWDFGDGSPVSASANPTHVYQNPGTYNAVLTVTDNGNATGTAGVTVDVLTNAIVYVYNQTVTRVQTGSNKWKGSDVVTIYDGLNQPVPGAVVTANYSGPNSGTVVGTTGPNGTVTFETAQKTNPAGTWCFTVTNVQAAGYTFNASIGEPTACEGSPKQGNVLPSSVEVTVSPNPFSTSTRFRIDLTTPQAVSLRVFDLSGRSIATIIDRDMMAGRHETEFHAEHLPAGLYLFRFEAGEQVVTGTVVLVK